MYKQRFARSTPFVENNNYNRSNPRADICAVFLFMNFFCFLFIHPSHYLYSGPDLETEQRNYPTKKKNTNILRTPLV